MYHITFPAESLQPRERLLAVGPEQLSHQELLSIVLRTGTKTKPVSMISHQLIHTVDSLSKLSELSLEELAAIEGIGRVKAIEIQAMIELGKRINQSENLQKERVLSSETLGKQMMAELGHKQQEHLVAIYLDTQQQMISKKTIFIGSVNRSIAEPREILYHAVKSMATSIIIVHNHPSGSVTPSRNDLEFTDQLKKSCETLGLLLLDHLVVGKSNYFSFREEGELT